MDGFFGGPGLWRAPRRWGIEQHGKIRCIDNARMSPHNAAAFIVETIMTAPADIAIQILLWLSATGIPVSWAGFLALRPKLGSDDLKVAYHGVPHVDAQLPLCVVAFRDVTAAIARVVFAVSFTHLFGFSAAVANFNRLPELLTAAARRIGQCTTWHYFDDLGTLELGDHEAQPSMQAAQSWVCELFALAGRPFADKKHQGASSEQVHLGLLNNSASFGSGEVSLAPRPGKLAELSAELAELLRIGEATPARILSLCGSLMFLILACFSRIGRGGLQPLFFWAAKHAAAGPDASLSKRKHTLDSQALTALEFFQFAIEHFSPRIFRLSRVRRPPLIAYSDAEWEVQLEACDSTRMLGVSKGLGGILFDGDDSGGSRAVPR